MIYTLRKPDEAAFVEVLKRSGLQAVETLFIDDNAANIAGAHKVGLQTIHLQNLKPLLELEIH